LCSRDEKYYAKTASDRQSQRCVSHFCVTLQTTELVVGSVTKSRCPSLWTADPKQFWRNTFHRENTKEKDMDHNKKRGEEEGEKGTPPQKIPGMVTMLTGPGAVVGGALYVLKGDAYIRLSIGGSMIKS